MKNKEDAIVCAVKQVTAYNALVWAERWPFLAIHIHIDSIRTEMDYNALKGIPLIRAEANSCTCDQLQVDSGERASAGSCLNVTDLSPPLRRLPHRP